MANVLNKKLYNQVIADAKSRFHTWPSAYASGWVVRRYKELGGKYKSSEKSSSSLDRWFQENWVNVCELPKIVPCGRAKAHPKNYPYCRPLKRITKDTPKTVDEISKKELKNRCKRKKKDPETRIV